MDPAEVIKNTFIFKTLNEKEAEDISKLTRRRKFGRGEAVMQEGQKGDSMYMLVQGDVEVSKTLTVKTGDDEFSEKEKILTSFSSEDNVVFGEMAMIDQENRSASVITKTDCILLEIKKGGFSGSNREKPEMGVKVLRRMAELLPGRVRQSSQDVIRLTTALSVALSGS